MPYGNFPPQILPPGSPSDKVPTAPPGTIFVLGPEGGYAVPASRYTLLFGRDREDVHVPVGVDDPTVSRRHGVFTCTGPEGDWWMRNTGRLPIELPDGALMLAGHKRIIEPGYTPLVINSSKQRSHLVEVRLVDTEDRRPRSSTGEDTVDPETVYELSPQERLVLTALAKRYLDGDDHYPLPLTWDDTAEIVNASPYATKRWTNRTVANTVEDVRERLHRRGIRGLMRDEVGVNVGATLSVNLIRELLKTATISAQDLLLLGESD
ncbi:FHA domain-containing protein [Actinospica sp.]|uniref:FHA domain-containing protein n=1 Tax=Actinospica sp. TaxID=1872142 RepID=UPI002BDDF470|nr:FHA domain-containing protein [Actinospica sp.]HWG22624.1 FHA domain-containing protein [Actinospica sp.]